jgi:hypothetical protein
MSDSPSFASTPYDPDRLFAGDFPVATAYVTITDNQSVGALTRGAVLGVVAGDYAIVHQTGSYPAVNAIAILARDVDPSGGDIDSVPVYLTGTINEDRISLGGTVTAAQVKAALEASSIFLKDPTSVA